MASSETSIAITSIAVPKSWYVLYPVPQPAFESAR